jgi:Flp pilus assembly protein TadB
VRLPSRVSPAAERRRAWLFDLAVALAVAAVAILLAAGIGVVGFLALLVAIALVLWYGVEALVRMLSRRRRAGQERRRAAAPAELRPARDARGAPPGPTTRSGSGESRRRRL